MAKVFSWRFNVRSYEVDQAGYVSPAVFQNYLEQTAIQASASNGYSVEWYVENHYTWVIRQMTVHYGLPLSNGDEIEARSWVSDFRRVRSNREYELLRVSDGQRVLRGRADWVFFDTKTMRIERIPDDFRPNFAPDPSTREDLGLELDHAILNENPKHFSTHHLATYYEIDEQGHVNNAYYLRWIEDSLMNALLVADGSREYLTEQGLLVRTLAHEIDYIQEVKWGDEVVIVGWLDKFNQTVMAWHHEIRTQTGEVIAKDRMLVGFSLANDMRQLQPLPRIFLDNL